MNKTYIILIVMGMFMISCVSAVTIYSGDTVYYDFTDKVDIIQEITWKIEGNSSNLDGLKITTNLTGAIMSIDPLFKSDSFTIIFSINGVNEVDEDCPSCKKDETKIKIEQVDNYITEYKDKIIIDDEEIQRLNDELKKRQDEIDKRNRALILSLVGFLALLCVMMFLIYKLVKKIKDAQK